jgi:hypothetical protein
MIIELLFSALVAAPAVAAGFPQGVVLSTQARVAADQRLSAQCAKPQFNVEAFLSDVAMRSDLATCTAEEGRDLLEYSVCRALQGAPDACAPLDAAKGSAAHCLTVAAEARFAFQTLSGGDALPACRNVIALDNQRGPSVDKSCAALIKAVRGGNAAVSCDALIREKVITPQESCEDIQVNWSGASRDCARYQDAGTRRECVARAALVAGLRDPAQCASSPACQALVAKSPVACDGLRVQFSRLLCTRVAKEVAAVKALEPVRPGQVEMIAKEKAAQTTAAATAAATAAVAAAKAKVEAAAVKAKAEALAEQEKVAKMAAAQGPKAAAAAAVVRAKAEAEAKKDAKAKADIAKKDKPQFKKGVPMQSQPIEAKEIMKALEEGRPIPTPKAPAKKAPKEEGAPADQ